MPAAMAPKRAMPEPIWKLEAAPVDSGASVELEPVPWKSAPLEVREPVAVASESEVEEAVRVAELMVVLRVMGLPVPEALAPVPTGVTGTRVELVPLQEC